MPTSINFDQVAGHAGNAVSDLFSGIGNFQAAGSYKLSAKRYYENADFAAESGRLQEAQAMRQVYQTIGGQKADVAATGFAASGSALDLLRDSAAQGAFARARIQLQTSADVADQKSQGDVATSQAKSEETAGIGNFIGTAFNAVAAVLPFLFLL